MRLSSLNLQSVSRKGAKYAKEEADQKLDSFASSLVEKEI